MLTELQTATIDSLIVITRKYQGTFRSSRPGPEGDIANLMRINGIVSTAEEGKAHHVKAISPHFHHWLSASSQIPEDHVSIFPTPRRRQQPIR